MGKAIDAKADRIIDAQCRLHRFRYYCARGFLDKDDKVLDCGCGTGYGTHILSRHCGEITGVDIEKPEIDAAIKNYGDEKTNFMVDDLETREIEPVDVVVQVENLEHLKDPATFMKKVKKATRKMIIVTIPMGKTTDTDPTHKHDFYHTSELDDMIVDDEWIFYYSMDMGLCHFAVYYKKGSL